MSFPITPTEFAVGFVIAIVGATIQGSIGFGLAVVGAPILLLVNGAFVPGPLLVAAMLLSLLMIVREHRSVVIDEVAFSTFGRMLTTLPAAAMVRYLPVHWFNTVFALAVLVAVLISLRGWHLPMSRLNVAIAGAISGVTGTISSIGGPPMALVYQNQSGPRLRATLSAIFALGTMLSIGGLWLYGEFGWDDWLLGLALMPGVIVGFGCSIFTAPILDRHATRPAVLAVSALSAVVILLKTWLP